MSEFDQTSDMQSSTASDYKEYFLKKFTESLKNLVDYLIANLDGDSSNRSKLLKINDFLNNKKINYSKLIEKLYKNDKLLPNLSILSDSNMNPTVFDNLLKKGTSKDWVLIPEFHVDKILLEVDDDNFRQKVIDEVKNIYICATSYSEIVAMITESDNSEEFNPFSTIVQNNNMGDIDVNTMFKNVEYKQMTSYEMLIKMLVDNRTEAKVGEYMGNIKEDEVNEAASKLDDVLKNVEANPDASKLLGSMLSNIKKEVIDLGEKNNANVDGKQAMENLMNIAKKVATDMSENVKESGLTPMEIWKATSSLAKSTVKSDALDIVDGIITQNISESGSNPEMMNQQDLMNQINKMNLMNIDDDDNDDN